MKRRVRFASWLFERSRIARTTFVLGSWPIVYVTDRWGLLGRADPPARLRDGLSWAWHGDLPRVPTIPTSDSPAVIGHRPRTRSLPHYPTRSTEKRREMTTTIGSNAVADQAPAAWVMPTVRHDDNRPVGPRIHGGWIHRAAGQSDPEHTRHYAALLLAAADETERRMADAQHTPTTTDRETEVSDPTSRNDATEGAPTMSDNDRIEIRKLALNLAREITAAVAANRTLDGDAGEYTLDNADRFAKWLETGRVPDGSRGQSERRP